MEEFLGNTVSEEDLARFEKKYSIEFELDGKASTEATFGYAVALIRSPFQDDTRKGISLLEELAQTHSEGRRDYIYYLALANARIKNFSDSLKYCKAFQEIEPNPQVHELEEYARKQYEKETMREMAVAGGAAIVIGGILGLGYALVKK